MIKILINNCEYEVYGKDEDSTNIWPHIVSTKDGLIPDGKQRGLLRQYLKENGIEMPDDCTTHSCVNKVLKIMNLVDASRKMDVGKNLQNNRINLNTILFGPPGTGKTYNAINYAVAICDGKSIDEVCKESYSDVFKRYNELKQENRINFVTFHQSYGYEEFIEGIKPEAACGDEIIDENEKSYIKYSVKSGVFKEFCEKSKECKYKQNNLNTHEHPKINENARVWDINLGGNECIDLKNLCFMENSIRIGWPNSDKIIKEDTEGLLSVEKNMLLQFQDIMQVGDLVVSRKNQNTIDGIGIVAGEYVYDESTNNEVIKRYPRKRKVEWLIKDTEIAFKDLNQGVKLARRSIYNLNRVNVGELLNIMPEAQKQDNGIAVSKDNRPFVFIIDEINRGNISKIFGELITLIEEDKREKLSAKLPYSNTYFTIPKNVYILGTMNTADRSIALLDTALRRRFHFVEMMPNSDLLCENMDGINLKKMLKTINDRIEVLYDREHTIGHAFFMGLNRDSSIEDLGNVFMKSIIPLLQEYFYDDYYKIQLVLGDNAITDDNLKFIKNEKIDENLFALVDDEVSLPEKKYLINYDAFKNPNAYIKIYESVVKNTPDEKIR